MLTLAQVTSAAVARRRPRPIEFEETTCLHCGGNDPQEVITATDPLATPGGQFHIVRCRLCGLNYTNPRPTEGSIAQFYPADYCCHDLRPRKSRSWLARWRAPLERAVLQTYYGYPTQGAAGPAKLCGWLGRAAIRSPHRRTEWIPFRGEGRLLDFGCGAGAFLQRMRALGWRVEGLDVSADVAQAVERQKGIRVHAGTLPHPDLAGRSFDAITMWQALEHVHRPRETLRAAGALFRPGGLLLVSVPNFESWSFDRFGRDWFGLELPRHLTHFTPSTLQTMLSAEGFDLVKLETIGMDGWIRSSARRAVAAGAANQLARYAWKPLALAVARGTQLHQRGDCLLALAQRRG
jgi:2-polyprenyl-3-methyl-5-hydroxy-6-metoxy-1,4-benzoquinol methylase